MHSQYKKILNVFICIITINTLYSGCLDIIFGQQSSGQQNSSVFSLPYEGVISTNIGAFTIVNQGNGKAIVGASFGDGENAAAIYGRANKTGVGVNNYGGYFMSKGMKGIGVLGKATATGLAENYGGYFVTYGAKGSGVYGEAKAEQSVACYGGFFTAANGCGVYGEATNTTGAWMGGLFRAYGTEDAVGVYGQAVNNGNFTNYGGMFTANGKKGIGIYALGGSEGYAGKFEGDVSIQGNLELTKGDVSIKGNLKLISRSTSATVIEMGEGLDYAEGFDVSEKEKIEPGTVLILDPNNPGKLKVSNTPYDKKVAGIVAGANGLGSGVRLGGNHYNCNVALAGRVYCNVVATDHAVVPGDLLTTSRMTGYAMKVVDFERAQGAILGKAMEPLEKGQKGQILVLVTLQ